MYSFSQISLRQQCPRKYQYRYIDKIKPEVQELSADLLLGNVIHKTLEKLYKSVNEFATRDQKKTLDFYKRLRDTKIKESESKGIPVTIKGADKIIDDYFRRGKVYIEQYYEKHAPFAEIKVVDTELKLNFKIGEKNSEEKSFVGYIDRLDKIGDTFFIVDYKTNQKLPQSDQDKYQEQLALYAYGVQQKYGQYTNKIKARLEYLHFEMDHEWEITKEEMDKIVNKYGEFMNQIENSRFQFNMGDDQAFPVRSNPFCKYCEYMSICPLWAHMQYEDESCEMSEKTIKKLVDEYSKTSKELTLKKKQQEVIKEILVKYLHEKNLKALFGQEYLIKESTLKNVKILDKENTKTKLTELGVLNEAMEIDRFKLKKMLDNGSLDINDLQSLVELSESSTLRVSEINENK